MKVTADNIGGHRLMCAERYGQYKSAIFNKKKYLKNIGNLNSKNF